MIQYEDLTKYLVNIAKRHPNLKYVVCESDAVAVNSPDFQCPAFIISPMPSTLLENSVVQHQFQLLYLDKLNQAETNKISILEDGQAIIIGFVSVIQDGADENDLGFKILKPVPLENLLTSNGGDMMVAVQSPITVQDQFNIERFKSKFYEQ